MSEPVAWASSLDFDDDDQEIIAAKDKGKLGTSNCDIPLYTAPKQWVSLTDEQIIKHFQEHVDTGSLLSFADGVRFAEAAHAEAKPKEKNQ